ncbi:MAG: FadR family transcriptional regulator [bacterium]|nr:FadR family transcriptional regulator [bacterium]
MAIRTIENRESLVDEVFEQMKEHIISGEWKPAQKIPSEHELSQSFNVSRTTIRNSIQKLKTIGVLTTKQGHGTFVRQTIDEHLTENLIPMVFLDKDNILDILEFRITVEMGSAGLAAERADKEDLERIQSALDIMQESLENYACYSAADYQFHLNIARASKNKIFYRVMLELKSMLYSHFEKMNRDLGPEMSIENHTRIFAAIQQKDAESARRLMRENIELSIRTLRTKTG